MPDLVRGKRVGRSSEGERAKHSAWLARVVVVATLLTGGCNYVGTFVRQSYYRSRIAAAPSPRIYKHLLQQQTYFVYGRITGLAFGEDAAIAVVAASGSEVVDVTQFAGGELHYGLNLPPGDYHLSVVHDRNRDGFFEPGETVSQRTLSIDERRWPEHVVPDIDLGGETATSSPVSHFRIAARPRAQRTESIFYPRGTLRRLDEPIFDRRMAAIGMYVPAAFLEQAPMMFYALEEDFGHKVPVIFVHGINGSARDFADMVARLDRRRYRPWFFHYPSGAPLDQLGAMFHEIFLSGRAIPKQETPLVIVAHSMGGLVVREALNHVRPENQGSRVACLITIASPLGGHPTAALSARAPVVIPSWRDLAPDSKFLRRLYRQRLPDPTDYHLAFTFQGPDPHEGTDGVVPVSSQRAAPALAEAKERIGFEATHEGVLHLPAAIDWVVRRIEEIKTPFTAEHLAEIDRGGYDLPLPPDFTPVERYLVYHLGHYMDALVEGRIQPDYAFQPQFVDECRHGKRPTLPASSAWRKLNQHFPHRPGAGGAPSVGLPQ